MPHLFESKDSFKESFKEAVSDAYGRDFEDTYPEERYIVLGNMIRDFAGEHWRETKNAIKKTESKQLYYFSMEFLMGRLMTSNLMNLNIYDVVKDGLKDLGMDINDMENIESDAGLGNGGLGRLAACFMDSLASLDLPGHGNCIRYRYGLFKQKIENNQQVELPDCWLKNGNVWEVWKPQHAVKVKFGGYVDGYMDGYGKFHAQHHPEFVVRAVPYDEPIVGYHTTTTNTLRLWDAEVDEDSVNSGGLNEYLNQVTAITANVYPDDSTIEGKRLRLTQEYFFVCAGIDQIIRSHLRVYPSLDNLGDKIAIQLNDTHPVLVIPELMRVLLDDYFYDWDDAWNIVTKTVAYTNHTVMAEALEKWPIELFSRLLPRIYQIVEEINRRFVEEIKAKYPGDQEKVRKMAVIYDGQVKMAHLAICAGYSVNGVAKLHTEILEKQELKDFYEMMPEKFNNKTNGITQRRFLLHANPLLADWITDKIGDGWITDLKQLEKLLVYVNDEKARQEFMQIKHKNKVRLAKYIKEHNGIDVNPDSIFDVQVKRLHEYKRQLLNILHIMYLYNEIKKNPDMDIVPRTFIFGAKAAAGYKIAKQTIKLINNVAEVINNDESINGKIKVVFIENYRVSNAEIIFAAADVSEQISTASKEASGTGNMKFMLNGAMTLGTMDGANVEIVQEVGADNAVIFGLSSDEVIRYENEGGYDPMEIFNNDQDIREVLMELINGKYSKEDPEMFRDIYNSLLNTQEGRRADTYFILKDFCSYADAQKKIDERYRDEESWAKTVMINSFKAGKFSSDRTIEEYATEIWKLTKTPVKVQ